jgi:methylmalonyl-CoA mutase cobalamin-binding subunit
MTPRAARTAPAGSAAAEGRLTIGTLAAATGIPAETIRTWERRYGFPVPERKESGHRLYALAAIPRLRRVALAIARGHRPAEVVPASDAALDALLAAVPLAPERPAGTGAPPAPDDLIGAARAFDGETLRRAFHADWARLGPLEFLERRAAPFLLAIGDAWESGALDVRHEHFASGCLGDFLRTVRAPLDDRAAGPIAVLATLPGELHGIGLQMAAVVFALHGWRALVLGVETPPEQIAALARDVPIAAVAVSVVRRRDGRDPSLDVQRLRRDLPRGVPLLLGGAGAARVKATRAGRIGDVLPDLVALDRWVREAPAA